MEQARPRGVSLLVIWLVFAGIIALVGGIIQILFAPIDPNLTARLYFVGLGSLNSSWDILRILLGIMLLGAGLIHGVSAGAIFMKQSWGIISGIIVASIAATGWIGVGAFIWIYWAAGNGILSRMLLPFMIAPEFLALIYAPPFLYMILSRQVRKYCGT